MNTVAVMLEIYRELQGVAELAAKRLPAIAKASEITVSDADKSIYRMAIFSAVLDDKPMLDATLDEIERLAKAELLKEKS